MARAKNLLKNTTQNFILKGFNSIQIGLYIILGAYAIEATILGFIGEENPLGMLSIEIIESICMFLILLVVFFSMFAVFFSSRRAARKSGMAVWNTASKKQVGLYVFAMVLGLFLLSLAKNMAVNYATPFFLGYLGLFMALVNSERKKIYDLLVVVSFLLAVVVFVIPTYWYSSLLILGASFFVYGIANRK